MQQTNENIIAELYAVRAGLSLISREYEAVKAIQDGSRQNEEDAKEKALSAWNDASNQKEIAERKAKAAESSARLQASNCKGLSTFTGGALIAAVVAAVICWIVTMSVTSDFVTAVIAAVSIAAVIAIGGVLIDVVFFLPTRRRKKKESAEEAERCAAELDRCNKMYEKASREYNSLFAADVGKRREADVATAISVHVNESEKIRRELINSYSATITESDWQNIDLIIFYFRSGRALTLREALQLVDRQRQTEAIIMEIRRATETICGEIRSAAAAITRSINAAVKTLGAQLEAQHVRLMGAMSCERVLLSALKEKADVACEELVKQSQYLASIKTVKKTK